MDSGLELKNKEQIDQYFTQFCQTEATSSSFRIVLYFINLIFIDSILVLFVLILNIAFLVLINCSKVSL